MSSTARLTAHPPADPGSAPGNSYIRPPFKPTVHPSDHISALTTPASQWIEPLSIPVHFPLPNLLSAVKDLALHPERNSTLILRADPLPASNPYDGSEPSTLNLEHVEEFRLRLMPKMPARDTKLDQRSVFFRGAGDAGGGRGEDGLVLQIPEVKAGGDIPYFHPPVRKLAYRYEAIPTSLDVLGDDDDNTPGDDMQTKGRISIAYLPFEDEVPIASSSMDPYLTARPVKHPRKRSPLAVENGEASESPSIPTNTLGGMKVDDPEERAKAQKIAKDRLLRTCLAILERVYKHAYGHMVGYQKRVHHDIVVPRETFQDLYLTLKNKHRHLDSRAPKPGSTKVEDVKRHVFKVMNMGLPIDSSLPPDLSEWGAQDVAIACFLMLLWKEMYPRREGVEVEREWDTWGRPEGGFVDLGCGNGLLVHILIAEGYIGKGYELRARRTWPLYPPETRGALVELPIDFPAWFPDTIEEWCSGQWDEKKSCLIPEDGFIIGNHADEITPWIPLLSLLPRRPVPYLSLPCCLHTLDSAFTLLTYTPPPHPHSPPGNFEEGLESGQSRYKAYLMWLGWCGLKCGWEWEKEGLRVPSTKGWGIVARKRWTKTEEELRECRAWALAEVQAVRQRGSFQIREKEGKDH